ncbi:MAG: hypothetical protein OHK0056_24310 [Bacteriovoracaceae bacterium]
MDDKKPLIFLNPLSESLQKLKEVMSESAEQDGIEIFEADSIDEMGQLLPNIGQSVVLTSNPKKCALMLQANRKVIRVLQSKVILLSPKPIPYRTLEKFMKIGLTECVVEPVAPKTLLYKVNLFIRSIGTKKSSGEMNSKFGLEGKDAPEEKIEKKVKELKRQNGEENEIEDTVIDNKSEDTQEEEIIKKKKKSNFIEAPIEGYYKGKTKRKDETPLSEDDEDESSGYKEEEIETFYKGDLQGPVDVIEEDLISKRKIAPTEEEILEALKKKIKVSVEEDLTQEEQRKIEELEEAIKKKNIARLKLDDDVSEHGEIREKDVEDLGGHYKGKISKGLKVEDDEEDFVDEQEDFEEELKDLKKKVKLDIAEDHEQEDFIDEHDDEDAIENKKRANLKVVDDHEGKDYEDKAEDNEEDKNDGPSIKLDVVNDEDSSNRDKLGDDENEEQLEKKAKVKLKVQNDFEAREKEESSEEEDDSFKSPSIKLKVHNDGDGKDYNPEEESSEDKDLSSKEKIKLKVQSDNDEDNDLDEKSDEDEADEFRRRRVEKTVKEEKEKDKREAWQEDLGGNLKRKSGESFKEEDNKKHNKADARADRIKTHYSSKESLKHQDDDWGNKWKKREKKEEEWKGPKEELALIIEKDALGEQTIDYKKLKEQFENIEFDGIPNVKKKYGIFSSKSKETKLVTKTIFHEDGTTEEVQIEELVEAKEEKRQKVYEPHPVGLDVAVEILSLYMIKGKKPHDILDSIAQKMWTKYSAQTYFFFFDKSKGKYDEVFSSIEKLEHVLSLENYEEIKFETKLKKDVEFNSWQFVKLPFWSDTTFREKDIQFVYPYFEGVNSMGFAVVLFKNGISENLSKTIEMIIETARGFYLDRTHELSGMRKDYGKKSSKSKKDRKENDTGEKKGFLKKLFGWAS